MLPILTFDEARLSPSHGYIFNRRWLCPHETILGIAWKLARMNALPGHIVAKQLALRPIDHYVFHPGRLHRLQATSIVRGQVGHARTDRTAQG